MKIKELTVKNFTVFEDAKFEFSPGLNVIIGENGTGKSHLLKLMYAILNGSEDRRGSGVNEAAADAQASLSVMRKLRNVFLPDNGELERLIRRNGAKGPSVVRLATDKSAVEISIRAKQHRADSHITGFEGSAQHELETPSLFLPPADVLALYEGKVVLKGRRFYVGKLEAHLVAAGYRKLAQIVRLIANGSIAPETALFWDEPEAGLNPQLITLASELILLLAKVGVQVFVATHDFLLSSKLSLIAEYQTEEAVAARPRFVSLRRKGRTAAVDAEWADTIVDLEYDPILAANAAHYDHEQRMFIEAAPRDK